MIRALLCIEVFRDSGSSALVTLYRDGARLDRVTVIPGDCFDLELEEGTRAVVATMPAWEDAADDRAAQDAIAAAELRLREEEHAS